MEENNIMNNEEVIEATTEEIVKATSHSGFKTMTIIGLAMITGGLAHKYVVEPVAAKIKAKRAERKAAKAVVADESVVYDVETEEDSEE